MVSPIFLRHRLTRIYADLFIFNHKSFCFLQRLVYDFGHVITYDDFIQSPTYYKLSLIFDEIRYSKQEIANRGPNEMR